MTDKSFEALAADPPTMTQEKIDKRNKETAAKVEAEQAKADKQAVENKQAAAPDNKAAPKGGNQ
jgi:hypothetical protein